MDQLIQNGLSNLEIETQHPHASSLSSSSPKEDEVKRNWVELPPDALSLIFLKLGTNGILVSAQWVCTSWWKLSKQPYLFCSIHVEKVLTLFGRSVHDYKLSKGLVREAIDRSGGQLVEFSVRAIATDELLLYMSEKSSSLRCIRLVSCHEVSDNGLIQMAKKLPRLVELEIVHGTFSKEVFETFWRFCSLQPCRLNYMNRDTFRRVAVAIAQNMHCLRHLQLLGNKMSNNSQREIFQGCPHLKFLDLRQCVGLNISGYLGRRCANIRARLPNDPTDDFEYERRNPTYDYSKYVSDDDEYSYFGMRSGSDDSRYDSDDEKYSYSEVNYESDYHVYDPFDI